MRKRRRPKMQEGGESSIIDIVTQLLEQGETPEDIVETLVSNNIPQQEAVSTIQGVMQQMGMMQEGGQKTSTYEINPELTQILDAINNYKVKNRGFAPKQKQLDTVTSYFNELLPNGYGTEYSQNESVASVPLNNKSNEYPISTRKGLSSKKEPLIEVDMFQNEIPSSLEGILPYYTAEDSPVYTPKRGRGTKSSTPSEVWKEVTGMDWSQAKKLGYSDGSAKGNLALMKKLKENGNFLVRPQAERQKVKASGLQMDPMFSSLKLQEGGGVTSQQQTQEEIIRYYQQGADRDTLINMLVQRGVDVQQATMYIDQIIEQLETMQEGGMVSEDDAEVQELIQMIVEAFNEGYSTEEIIAQLVEAKGLTTEVATSLVEQIANGM